MTKITPHLLNDTLNIVALAREAARVRGNQVQAERFAPVEEGLRHIVAGSRQTDANAPVTGVLAQNDFQTLMSLTVSEDSGGESSQSAAERNQVIQAMAAGGMNDMQIAKQMGMTRDEIRIVLRVGSQS
ncbi:MAG: hypothetical protein DWQ07_05165 [Chloroflexi bacterium]|nr:MAG: hypothetical protein DWQ07_05165 [Chloroflexota bacterium]MBL1194823.1 hypothetical protein [Chloroflexota bacterium]NOH12114.1 hypothetical protein [Chloroflexota bacterium]